MDGWPLRFQKSDGVETDSASRPPPTLIPVILTCVSRELHPRRTFRISRARRTEVRNVFVRLEKDGLAGYGEASPNSFYDETWESVTERLERARDFIGGLEVRSLADIETAWREAWRFLAPSRAAQCALDVALWDWFARREGLSVSELIWKEAPKPVVTFATIGLSSAEELPEKIEELRGFPRIKIKSDAEASLQAVQRVSESGPGLIAVDANCAWRGLDLRTISQNLAALGVEFIEQPFPPEFDRSVPESGSCLPVMADESCVTEDDVPRVLEHFAGFNIKLVKCGGITPARRMVEQGLADGKTVMVGCMLESSALIAAGAAIAQRSQFADLDGAWLIGDDPFRGWRFDRGTLHPPKDPGLGITPEPGLFP
jgi:L-alanine-DL-glutamate epimerase-like enolase superfamily enzyme